MWSYTSTLAQNILTRLGFELWFVQTFTTVYMTEMNQACLFMHVFLSFICQVSSDGTVLSVTFFQFNLLSGGDTETLESGDTEAEQDVERDIEKISKTAAKVVLLVAFSVNSFDYSSINRKLNPLENHLKVKTWGMGKYEMACWIAKYVVPRDPAQELNYNCIKRTEIKSNKSLNFLFDKSPKPSSSDEEENDENMVLTQTQSH